MSGSSISATLPEHLVVVGGSYIALEFAQMYRRFGARVSVVEKGPRLTSREDEDVSAAIKEILEAEGIDIHLGATDMRIVKQRQRVSTSIRATVPSRSSATHLLVATGRQPNTDDLGLDVAGVETDARGFVKVDDQLRTNVEHIWAMGDCNGKGAFTHTSYNDFEIVAANLLDDDPRRVSDRITTYALYIDPPLGRAGMTVDEVRASGRKALVGKRPMTRVGRAVEKGETQGFMKVVVDAETKEILGAAILGVGGDEVVQDILDVMTAKLPYTAISRTMHIHPTVSELVPTMLQEMTPLDRCRSTSSESSAVPSPLDVRDARTSGGRTDALHPSLRRRRSARLHPARSPGGSGRARSFGAVPARTEPEIHPMHVVLCGEHGQRDQGGHLSPLLAPELVKPAATSRSTLR